MPMTTPERYTDRNVEDVTLPGDSLPAQPTPSEYVATPGKPVDARRVEVYTDATQANGITPTQTLAASPMRRRDLDLQPVWRDTTSAIVELHAKQQFDEADELLDKTFPYGTLFYFGQAVKNARARANAAQSVE